MFLCCCQQYVGGQQVMQLQLSAGQQQLNGQDLYANGYPNSSASAAAGSAQKQMSVAPEQTSADYR